MNRGLRCVAVLTLFACGSEPPSASEMEPKSVVETDIETEATDTMASAPGPVSASPPPTCTGKRPVESDAVRVIQFGGLERSFQVHVPKSYDPRISMPVVFVFHAFGSDVLQMMLYARFREKADREGFIVVHPQGRLNSWNGGTCCGVAASQDVDDVGFVRATLNSLKSDLCIDPKRVFATGMSNGGFFAHRLACELSDEIAAVASVAGVLGVSSCQPRRPVPVLQIHGTADAVVPFSGNAILGFRSVPATVATWRRLNACQNRSRITLRKPDSACEAWSECQSGSEVVLCTVRLGGHTWPGAFPLPGAYTSPFLDATDVAWDFMRTHPIP